MFKSWFGKKSKTPERVGNDPAQLQKGDIIELSDSFGLPSDLRGARFSIQKISSYEFESGFQVELQLEGATLYPLFLNVEDDDGEILLNFSRKLERSLVGNLFDLDTFANVFEGSGHLQLAVKSDKGFEGWVAEDYQQTAQEVQAYYYSGWDLRKKPANKDYEEDGEELRYYELKSPDGRKVVEAEVWDGGDTDISLTLSVPAYDIVDIYPAGKQEEKSGWLS